MIRRVETHGSIWTFDEDLHRYMRLPKHEKPRDRPEWGGPEAGALQDGVWRDYLHWRITDRDLVIHHPVHGNRLAPAGTLVVYYPVDANTSAALVAPEARVL